MSDELTVKRKRGRLYESISSEEEAAIREAAQTPDVRLNRNIIRDRRKRTSGSKVSSHAREKKAVKKIDACMFRTAALGLIPLPLVDLSAIVYQQMQLVREIAAIYNLPARQDSAMGLVAEVWKGYNVLTAGGSLFGSAVKSIPLLGAVVGGPTLSIMAAASSYGLGQTLLQHIREDGGLEQLRVEKAMETYQHYVEEGKRFLKNKNLA